MLNQNFMPPYPSRRFQNKIAGGKNVRGAVRKRITGVPKTEHCQACPNTRQRTRTLVLGLGILSGEKKKYSTNPNPDIE